MHSEPAFSPELLIKYIAELCGNHHAIAFPLYGPGDNPFTLMRFFIAISMTSLTQLTPPRRSLKHRAMQPNSPR
jgi:hypothetical protein